MKIKRTILSALVVISVFCLSVIFDIQYDTHKVKNNSMEADKAIITNDTAMESTASTDEISAYASDTMATYLTASQARSIYSGPELSADSTRANTDTSIALQDNNKSEAISATKDEVKDLNSAPKEEIKDLSIEEAPVEETSKVQEKAPKTSLVKESRYANIGISIAKSYVNIRESASMDGKVLGKLYKGAAAEILKSEGDWFYVESGSVKGYLKAEYLKTGIPDDKLIKNYGIPSAKVMVDGLNVRMKPDTESDKLTVIYKNEIYPVIEMQDEWLKLDVTDDREIGYVKSEYVELIVDFEDAISREEEMELQRLKEEERIKKETEIKYRDEVSYTKDDLKLLTCLVQAEAGNQSYEGKLAVANVVLNRVKSSKYPDSIKAVIYQSGQFSVASSGSLDKQLANYDNYTSNSQRLTMKAARAALEGANNIGSRLYFHSYESAVKKGYDKKSNCVKLQDHLFW